MGGRLGPNASGKGSNGTRCVTCALPSAPGRELMAAPLAPGQVGYPPTMNSYASLGLSSMRYQSSEAAFGPCDADGCLSVRLVGTTPRAPSATNQNLAHRTRVGSCRCRARATDAALPATHALGEYSGLKAISTVGPRRLAGLHYAETFGSPPSPWDWATASPHMYDPDPLLRAPANDNGLNLNAQASTPPQPQPPVDSKTGITRLRGDTQ